MDEADIFPDVASRRTIETLQELVDEFFRIPARVPVEMGKHPGVELSELSAFCIPPALSIYSISIFSQQEGVATQGS